MRDKREFDVFLSYNGRDRAAVLQVAEALRARGIRVWIDEWELPPGQIWVEKLDEIIRAARVAVVFVGDDGLGPWTQPEVNACLIQAVRRKMPIIPVLLPGAPSEPELPSFLEQFSWVDLRAGMSPEGLDRLQWGIAEGSDPAAADGTIPAHSADDNQTPPSPIRVPSFDCGGVVPPERFINRDRELAEAQDIIEAGQNFLLIGERRAGKTSFCVKVLHDLLKTPGNTTLGSKLNLESCAELTIRAFLGHTVLNMIGEINRTVFGRQWADLDSSDDRLPLDGASDEAYEAFQNVYRRVKSRTHTSTDGDPSPLLQEEFVQLTGDLLDIIRSKGWHQYVMFYDEANLLPRNLSISLLMGLAEVLNSSNLVSVYAASPEMAESAPNLDDSIGHQIQVGPFSSVQDMRRLLARHYHNDASRTDDLPATDNALEMVWRQAQQRPFQIQLLLNYTLRTAQRDARSTARSAHVAEAHRMLHDRMPHYF